jgi:peptidoglycan/xylan/chitin deacetylase (PgdA/CDA1 family)
VNNIFSATVSNLLPSILSTTDRLSILIYHRVLPKEDFMRPNEPTVDTFDWQMELISKYFSPLSLTDALALMEKGMLPKNAICVTFDDGYADNEKYALPILTKWKVPATVFVSTAFINGGIMWNDIVIEVLRNSGEQFCLDSIGLGTHITKTNDQKREAAYDIISRIKHMESSKRSDVIKSIVSICTTKLPTDLMLKDEELLNLVKAGIEIGGHTVNHPILAKLSNEKVLEEVLQGKNTLEKIINKKIRYFAYPNGKPSQDYKLDQVEMVKKSGFEAALSTVWGVSSSKSDKFQLARFTPWDKTPEKFLLRLLLNQRKLVV